MRRDCAHSWNAVSRRDGTVFAIAAVMRRRISPLSAGFGTLASVALCAASVCVAEEGASVSDPGPDLANFPNSAFTLPAGRAYVEWVPLNHETRDRSGGGARYSAGYLLRYGVTNDVEFRLLSSGYVFQRGAGRNSGLAPLVFDLKWHVADEDVSRHLPAFGIEVALETNLAKRAYRAGNLPSVSFNFDQALPWGIAFEYNVGCGVQLDDVGRTQYQAAFSWALQREVIDDVALFVNGYTNAGEGAPSSAVGVGGQWNLTRRWAFFTNVSTGLTANISRVSTMAGFAVAF